MHVRWSEATRKSDVSEPRIQQYPLGKGFKSSNRPMSYVERKPLDECLENLQKGTSKQLFCTKNGLLNIEWNDAKLEFWSQHVCLLYSDFHQLINREIDFN